MRYMQFRNKRNVSNVVSHTNIFTFKYAVPPMQMWSNGCFSWLLAPKVIVPERLISIDLGNFCPKNTNTPIKYSKLSRSSANERKIINKKNLAHQYSRSISFSLEILQAGQN